MTEEKTRKSEIDYLKELIMKSGFPLEIEIASYIDSRLQKIFGGGKFATARKVAMSTYYLDRDDNKGRELDIKVPFPIFYPIYTIGVSLNLLIACKRIPGNSSARENGYFNVF